jgi:hypothetical protein
MIGRTIGSYRIYGLLANFIATPLGLGKVGQIHFDFGRLILDLK